jgi:hypothetical protein
MSEVISRDIQGREPDPNKGEGEVFAYVDLEDWNIRMVNDLPIGIQDIPIAIDLQLYYGLWNWLPAFLVSAPATSIDSDIASTEERFAVLANRWHDETDFVSSPSRVTGNDTYLQIISMGKQVIPLILEDLKERGGYWYRALRILSGEDPVPIEAKGDVEQMKRAWLEWGRERGYIK